ncbi:MAG: UbiD family decarboxylase, partial [Planctomycetia bacterium]
MGYRNLQDCIADLEKTGRLRRVDVEVDPHLEVAEIQRRVYRAGGPALLFTRPKDCEFPLLANLYGTLERTRFLFRDALDSVRKLVEVKVDPEQVKRRPWRYVGLLKTAWNLRPKTVGRGPILAHRTTIDRLPKVVCWPNDGGPFVTLPQVYSEDAERPGFAKSNLGMYRIQLSGNEYKTNDEIGLHYQLHRGIGVHHAAALRAGKPFRVNVFVGGPPALAVAAVMPLPEGLPELAFAGALGGRRLQLVKPDRAGLPMPAEADFCITGVVDPDRRLPEGPFGDHLGYYALVHPFPVLKVERVYHRPGAVWPFTSVGRPPQEDTSFGEFIHELTGPLIPTVIPGVHAVNAVDAAGVHPLLLAVGSERYTPYAERRRPQELLTQANAILGQGQLSLAKYLLIVAKEDDPDLDVHDEAAVFRHLFERIDWTRDVHFQTCTTMDTLDYSGGAFNEGSKVVWAAVGPKRRTLATEPPRVSLLSLPEGWHSPTVCLPGVLAVGGPPFAATGAAADDGPAFDGLKQALAAVPDLIDRFPLVVLVDDPAFTARTKNNFLWTTFTRSNPAADVTGVGSFTRQKHWGCTGPLVV